MSTPEHATPKRARAYLVTDDDVARVVAYFGPHRPQLDGISRAALDRGPADVDPAPWYLADPHRGGAERHATPKAEEANPFEAALWAALCSAPEEGSDIHELMQATGMGRSTIYRYLGQLADEGRAVQVGWGLWRASATDSDDDE